MADRRSRAVLALEAMGFIGIGVTVALIIHQSDTVTEKSLPEHRHEFLEDRRGERALEFVRALNAPTLETLKSDPKFEVLKRELSAILMAKDRIPSISEVEDGLVYGFWQDATHVQGVWRRQPLEKFVGNSDEWEVLLDLDALSKAEGKTWVWHGAVPNQGFTRFLISLSPGGSDATEVREFDLATKTFVAGGIGLPEAKTDIAWVTDDLVAFTTNGDPEAVTKSGYPRKLEVLSRTGSLASLASIPAEDMGLFVSNVSHGDQLLTVVTHALDFYRFKSGLVEVNADGQLAVRWLDVPLDWELKGLFQDELLFLTKKNYVLHGRTIIAGSLLSVSRSDPSKQSVVFEPKEREALQGVVVKQDAVYLSFSKDVKGRLLKATRAEGWSLSPIEVPDHGVVALMNTGTDDHDLFYQFESFLVPPSLMRRTRDGKIETLRQLPHRFDVAGMKVEQHEAVSSDGERIPFFVVLPKDFQANGRNPTLLYGYGGFEISMTPFYLTHQGKAWLERGGIYVLSNIRGGGEFGPAWHQAALKENRQKAYDDFYAIAEKLIEMKYTSPRHLGIEGGSNGGLLTGVAISQRPELFRAAIIAVPLLDMLRYHLHPAGDSWTAEYGSPDVPAERPALARISPYHNLKDGVTYPEVFIWTSTADDRVHPLHARKMAARLQELGQKFFYYENIEGGHGGAANLIQRVEIRSMCYVYLLNALQ